MKTNRVAVLIMIMLGFVQILEIEATKLPCPLVCAIQCLTAEQPYPVCFLNGIAKCQLSTSDSNCAITCGVNKTITVNIGIYYLTIFMFLFIFLLFIIELIMFLHFFLQ